MLAMFVVLTPSASAQLQEEKSDKLVAQSAVDLIIGDLLDNFSDVEVAAPAFEFTKSNSTKNVMVIVFTNPLDSIFTDSSLNSFMGKPNYDENGLIIDNGMEVVVSGGCRIELAIKNNVVTDQIKTIRCTNIRLLADEPQDDKNPITYSVSISQ